MKILGGEFSVPPVLLRFVGLTLAVVAFVLVAFALVGSPFGARQTLGFIWVDGPEVYTRERLVNDRFVQDAWLNRQLQKSDGAKDAIQLMDDRRSMALRSDHPPAQPEQSDSSGPRPQADRPVNGAEASASQAQLMIENDFRDLVRSLIIENQLDDRHDLNGNSLYMLKFNASVVPGANTQSSAVVHVRLSGPALLSGVAAPSSSTSLGELGSTEQIRAWSLIYSRWIDNLRSRLNQAHRELKLAYRNNEFSHNDYSRIIAFATRNLHAPTLAQCPESFVVIQGQEADPAQLSPREHLARKACIASIVRNANRAGNAEQVVNPGYIVTLNEAKPTAAPLTARQLNAQIDLQEERLATDLNSLLNKYFASKTMQLVLGISLPESSFVGQGFYDLPALRQLIQLSFFSSNEAADDESAFVVSEKIFSVTAIAPDRISADNYKKVATGAQALSFQSFSDFTPMKFPSGRQLLVSATDLAKIGEADLALKEGDFTPATTEGVLVATAHVGLLNFARKARLNIRAFTYSVYPKERGDTVVTSLAADSSVNGSVPLGKTESVGSMRLGRESLAQTLQRRGVVIGFGQVTPQSAIAEFGWVVNPRQVRADGQHLVYVQAAAQHSLSALVSIPAWWNEVNLEVTTSWITPDGRRLDDADRRTAYSISIPVDFEPLETNLLEVQQLGPELMESRLDPIRVTACKESAIVIPGRRLWRSTKVTLGYQTADEISVLPDMKGIVARFRPVQNQISLSETATAGGSREARAVEIRRPVRVWTSQGAVTLPSQARIGIPPKCEVTGGRP